MSLSVERASFEDSDPELPEKVKATLDHWWDTAPEHVFQEKARLARECRKFVVSMEAQYGYLERNHPVAQTIAAVTDRLLPHLNTDLPAKVLILDRCENEEGLALPDGTVIFSKPMLRRLQTEDELAALCAHEFIHVQRRHGLETLQKLTQGLRATQKLGDRRMGEYEADLVPMATLLPKAGYHPLAGATLWKRLGDELEGREWSLAHGGLEDRRLNMLSVSYFLDLPGIERVQKPLPSQWQTWLAKHSQDPSSESEVRDEHRALCKELQNPDGETWARVAPVLQGHFRKSYQELLELIGDLPPKQRRRGKIVCSPYVSVNQFPAYEDMTRFQQLTMSLDAGLAQTGQTAQQRTPQTVLRLMYRLGIPLLRQERWRDGETRPAIELLDVPTTAATGDEKFLGFQLAGAVTDQGLDAFTEALDLTAWQEARAYGELHPELLFDCIAYVDHLDGFHDLDSGEFSWEILNDQVRRFLEHAANFEAAVGLYPYPAQAIKRKLLYYLKERYSFDDETLRQCLPEIALHEEILIPLPGAKERRIKSYAELLGEHDPTHFQDLAQLLNIIESLKNARGESERTLKETFRQNVDAYFRGHLKTLAQDLPELLARLPAEQRSSLAIDFLLVMDESDYWHEPANFSDPGVRCAFTDLFLNLSLPEFELSDSDFTVLYAHYVRTELAYSFGSNTAGRDHQLRFFSEVAARRFDGKTSWIESVLDGQYLLSKAIIGQVEEASAAEEAWQRYETLVRRFGFDLRAALRNTSPEARYFHGYATDQIDTMERSQKLVERLWPIVQHDLGKLLLLGGLFSDSDVHRRVLHHTFDQLLPQLSYPEARQIVMEQFSSPADTSVVIEQLVERLAQTPAELTEIQRDLEVLYRRERDQLGGINTYLDGFLRYHFHQPTRLLKASLSSRSSDTDLVVLAFQEWWERLNRSKLIFEHFDPHVLTYFGSPGSVSEWVEQAGQAALRDWLDNLEDERHELRQGQAALYQILSIQELLERLYRTDLVERHVILRKLLMDPQQGILSNRNLTQEVTQTLLDEHVALESGHDTESGRIVSALLDTSSSEELYFLLSPFLAQAMFQSPESQSDRRRIVCDQLITSETERLNDVAETMREFWNRPIEGEAGTGKYKTLGKAMAEKVFRWAFPEQSDEPAIAWAEARILATLPEVYQRGAVAKRLSEMQAVQAIATQLGAPGVRFLQLLGQYVRIPKEMAKEFAQVYDRVRGQSKLAAFQTIQREVPELLAEGDRLGDRLGGGSLVTTYLLTKPGKIPLVVKVLNPNAAYRVRESSDIARRTAQHLAERYPENPTYRLVRDQLLDDIEQWLLADIADERFIGNDHHFRSKWNNWTSRGHVFRIRVPESFDVQTHKVKVEEFIEGTNLTQVRVGEVSDFQNGVVTEREFKDIVSLAVKHFESQLRDGLIHSDVHKGNLRLTPEGELAILDRNFYIELNGRDKRLFLELALRNRVKAFLGYLFDQEQATEVVAQRAEIERVLLTETGELDLAQPDGIQELLAAVKHHGVKVPLKITLILKNLNALNQLCREAGFASIAEARSYRPDKA